jgi:hypothetical protein
VVEWPLFADKVHIQSTVSCFAMLEVQPNRHGNESDAAEDSACDGTLKNAARSRRGRA